MTNVLNVLKFEADKDLKKLRHPVDKDKWSTEPAVANAFYSPNKNDIGRYLQTALIYFENNKNCLQFSQRVYCNLSFTVNIFQSR